MNHDLNSFLMESNSLTLKMPPWSLWSSDSLVFRSLRKSLQLVYNVVYNRKPGCFSRCGRCFTGHVSVPCISNRQFTKLPPLHSHVTPCVPTCHKTPVGNPNLLHPSTYPISVLQRSSTLLPVVTQAWLQPYLWDPEWLLWAIIRFYFPVPIPHVFTDATRNSCPRPQVSRLMSLLLRRFNPWDRAETMWKANQIPWEMHGIC